LEAGTISLAVSIPTVAVGAFTVRRLGGLRNPAIRLAVVMGIASLVADADQDVIKGSRPPTVR
jgi:hypothetical protein